MPRLLPRTLLLRTFLLIAVLMLLSLLSWFAIFTHLEREPRSQQMAQMLVSVANLTRAAMITAHPSARRVLLRELSDRESIHIYPAEDDDKVGPAQLPEFIERTGELVREQLGPETRIALELNGEYALFVSFHIGEDEYWVALPRERIERKISQQWLGWSVAAALLALLGAWLIIFRITRPLKALSLAAREIGQGRVPAPLPEHGPTELSTVSRAFNQMSTDLARMDSDRALILAGISHDLRTPLTRLRMGIEMSGADEFTRDAMAADVEEIDKTIGQFLDFAREDGGEPLVETNLSALLEDIATHYARLGYPLQCEIAADLTVPLRPKTIRRAITNLIDNALRYAPPVSNGDGDNDGDDNEHSHAEPILLGLQHSHKQVRISIADRGPGIPPDQVARVKLPFTRLDEARGNMTGAGLGLAIVERIARNHGGAFDLLPRPGGGLLAQITLPEK